MTNGQVFFPGGSVSGISTGSGVPRQAQPTTSLNGDDNIHQYLENLRKPGAGQDFFSITNPQGPVGFQQALPPIDLKMQQISDTQIQGTLTVNSLRGGLGAQRDVIERAVQRMSTSSLVTHATDEVILPFETVKQTNYPVFFPHATLMSANFVDRAFMTPYMYPTTGSYSMWAETSVSDPTVIPILTAGYGAAYSMGTVSFAGQEYLGVCTETGMVLYTWAPNSLTGVAEIVFFVTSDPVVTPHVTYGTATLGGGGGSTTGILIYPYGGGQATASGATSTTSYLATSFIQGAIPGDPLIVRAGRDILLARTDQDPATFAASTTPGTSLILRNVGLGNAQPMGFQSVGGRPARAYWWESSTGSPISAGGLKTRIASTNDYGSDYQVLRLSMKKILGAVLCRDGMALEDGARVVFFNGREDDLGLFANQKPSSTYTEWCIGVGVRDHQLFAMVNELPMYTTDVGYGTGIARGRVRAQWRRYDFELRKWSSVSDWTTLCEDGLINWTTGVPFPVASGGITGVMSAYGSPSLPIGPVTQHLHEHAVPGYYTPDLSTTTALPPNPSVTWMHKFQENAGTNPFALRGTQTFAEEGDVLLPGLLFPGDTLYADKYLDGIGYGGDDTGGADSKVTISWGEFGRDAVDGAAVSHAFSASEINPASRYWPVEKNASSVLFPQIGIHIDRGNDDETLTPEVTPFTLYFHIDMTRKEVPSQRAAGRAQKRTS